ncbi:GNAT family N-acetyltransferase [Aldersonia sp. NBC_00410]|nr:GNAT family N-acetyltransferase [Aldersonia sp. NBC_00410]
MNKQRPGTAISRVRIGPVWFGGRSVVLRPPRFADFADWSRIRLRDRRLIEPFWFASPMSWEERHTESRWIDECIRYWSWAHSGNGLPLAVEVDGRFVGQINLVLVPYEACTGELSLWIDSEFARLGVGSVATEMLLEYAFEYLGVFRVTAPIAVDNAPILQGMPTFGFLREAVMVDYMEAGGRTKDHELWSMTADRWKQRDNASSLTRASASAEMRPPRAAESRDVRPFNTLRLARILAGGIARFEYVRLRALFAGFAAVRRVNLECSGFGLRVRTANRSDRASLARIVDQYRPDLKFYLGPASRLGTSAPESYRQQTLYRTSCLARQHSTRALAIEANGHVVGFCGLSGLGDGNRSARLFVCVAPGHANRGIAKCAVRAVLRHAFEDLQLRRVSIALDPSNSNAERLAENVGLRREGTMHCYSAADATFRTMDLWACTRATNQPTE